MTFGRTVSIVAAKILVGSATCGNTFVIVADLMRLTILMGRAFNRTTAESFIVGIAKEASETFTNRRMILNFADRIASTNDSFTRIFTVVEATEIWSASGILVTFVVIVATIFDSWNTDSSETCVVGRTITIFGADLKALSRFTFFI